MTTLREAKNGVREAKIGELLVAERIITPEQLQEALGLQARLETYVPLGHLLVARRVITRRQLKVIAQLHRRRSRLGQILLNSRCISAEQLALALAEQKGAGLPLGEMLVRLVLAS